MSEPLDLDAIQALADAATLGPWIVDHQPNHHPDDPEWSIESAAMEFDDPIGVVDTDGLSQGQGDAEFIAASRALIPALVARVRELEPRVLEGDWETVRDALDALPEGAQIRWRASGPRALPTLGIKITNVMGHASWSTTGLGILKATTIARDETPIEVIA